MIAPSSRSRADALAIVRADLGECTRCKLHKGRTNVVFGVGNAEARLMFVGEGPGADEDVQGEPFVGRAGQQLTKIINAMGFEREDVYIANVVKCRPPGNRNPEPDEIEQCEPFLMRQIDVLEPAIVVALGKFAAQTLLRTSEPITKLRGRFHRIGDIRGDADVPPVLPAAEPRCEAGGVGGHEDGDGGAEDGHLMRQQFHAGCRMPDVGLRMLDVE